MEDEKEVQDVQVESSTTPEVEQSSNESQEVAQPETELKEMPVQQEKAVPTTSEEVDEMGVSYKNRFMESERKRLKILEEREELLKQQNNNQQVEPPKYTIAQLKAFTLETEDPANRAWALNEIDRLSKEESISLVRNEIQNYTKKQQEELTKQKVFNDVVARNPELVIKDSMGNITGYNEKSPLYTRMNYYMKNPEIFNNPLGLDVAEALALRDLSLTQKPVIAKKIEKQANQIKALQKNTMIEGSGSNSRVSVSSRQAAVDKARQTGSMKDSANAMGAILRDAGLLTD